VLVQFDRSPPGPLQYLCIPPSTEFAGICTGDAFVSRIQAIKIFFLSFCYPYFVVQLLLCEFAFPRNANYSSLSYVTNTRGHQYKLYKSHCSHSTRSRFFAERVINVWNCLSPSVDYSTLATFRRSIDGIDFTSSLKCDTDWVLSYIIGQLCVLLFFYEQIKCM